MKRSGIRLLLLGAMAISAALGGCREEEQNRVLLYNKGVYAGKADTPLSPEALRAIRQRSRHQSYN